MAFYRLSTTQPVFHCADCAQASPAITGGPPMLHGGERLGEPRALVRAHKSRTGHRIVLLLGGYGSVVRVDPSKVTCIWCMGTSYLATPKGIAVCPCVEEQAIALARGESVPQA